MEEFDCHGVEAPNMLSDAAHLRHSYSFCVCVCVYVCPGDKS